MPAAVTYLFVKVSSALDASVVHFDRVDCRQLSNGAAIVVIDVLRATTVIVCALANGARDIIPVGNVKMARDLAGSIDGAVLGGEEHNQRIPGFDLGNSPIEYDSRVRGKTVIMRTTNGTRVLAALRGAKPVWCGAFANLVPIAGYCVASERAQPECHVILGACLANGLEQVALADSQTLHQISRDALYSAVDEVVAPVTARELASQLIYRSGHDHETVELHVTTARQAFSQIEWFHNLRLYRHQGGFLGALWSGGTDASVEK